MVHDLEEVGGSPTMSGSLGSGLAFIQQNIRSIAKAAVDLTLNCCRCLGATNF